MNKQGVGRALMVLIGSVLLGTSPQVEAGQWVVIAAEQTSLQPGALLDGKQPVKLADGARLTLLAEDGKTLKLTGPYSGVPGSGGATGARTDNLTAIASLLRGHPQSTSTLGAMRGNSSREPSTADLINVDHSGERCLNSDPVVLWRGNAADLESVTLTDAQGARLASFTWSAGEARLPTPGRYFEDGKTYLLQRPDKSVSLRIHKAAAAPSNQAALAAWMAKSGCKAQALSVLSQLTEE